MSGPANLDQQLDAYLAIREAVGLTNKSQYRLLRDFVAYVQNAGVAAVSPIRAATAVRTGAELTASLLLVWPAKGGTVSSRSDSLNVVAVLTWAWDCAPATCGVRGRADRLMVVRGFLSFLASVIPGTEVPASRNVAGATRRRPYIFSDYEVGALISAAACPSPRNRRCSRCLSMYEARATATVG